MPGSQFAEGVRAAQVRWFSKQLKKSAPIASLVLESEATASRRRCSPSPPSWRCECRGPPEVGAAATGNAAAPTIAPARAGGRRPSERHQPPFSDPVPQPPAAPVAGASRAVLLVGGGSSQTLEILRRRPKPRSRATGWVDFTQNLNGIAEILPGIDVLVLSANQLSRRHAQGAHRLRQRRRRLSIALHPGCWCAWNKFPAVEQGNLGGGTRATTRSGPTPSPSRTPHPIGQSARHLESPRRTLQLPSPTPPPRRLKSSPPPPVEERQNLPASLREHPEGAHRRPHPRPRRPRPRPPGLSDAGLKNAVCLGRREVVVWRLSAAGAAPSAPQARLPE